MNRLTELLERFPLPDASGGKDTKGNVVIVGGPPTCPGAAVLAGTAALRAGSGRVQLIVHPEVAAHVATALPEVLVLGWDHCPPVPEPVAEQLGQAEVLVVGSGYASVQSNIVKAVVNASDSAHVLLDAGALDASHDLELGARLVIAPNAAEAERLLDREGDEAALAPMLAQALDRPVAVRGQTTVIAQAESWLFDDSPPGLGTPGSGDVFIGLLAGLLACGAQDLQALAWAVAIHARAGGLLSADAGIGYLATEIASEIPRARVELRDAYAK